LSHGLNLALFAAAALALIIVPGPDMIYVATRGVSRGRGMALVSALGVCSGYVVHTAFAAVGLSALLAQSVVAFGAIKYAGAVYLIYLGLRTILSKAPVLPGSEAPEPGRRNLAASFGQGALTSIINPKGILFFLAFLPQFVDPSTGGLALQTSVLGLVFALLCLLVYGAVAVFSGALGSLLRRYLVFASALKWLTGSVFIGLGLHLVIPERR